MDFNIESLPNECLANIFLFVVLPTFIRLNQVSPRFASIRNLGCHLRHELTLLVGRNVEPLLHNCIEPCLSKLLDHNNRPLVPNSVESSYIRPASYSAGNKLYQRTLVRIMNTFPNIRTLRISANAIPHIDEYRRLAKMLSTEWATGLNSLHLWFAFKSGSQQADHYELANMEVVLRAINQLPNLRELSIWCPGARISRNDFTIVSQLHIFSLTSEDTVEEICESINPFASTNENLERIAFGSIANIEDLKRAQTSYPRVTSKFSVLRIKPLSKVDQLELPQLFVHFCSVTKVELALCACTSNLQLVDLVNCLAQAPQLTHLKLHCDSFAPFDDSDSVDQSKIAQLLKLRVLDLSIEQCQKHEHLYTGHLAWIFPALQVLQIKGPFTTCRECFELKHDLSRLANFEEFDLIDWLERDPELFACFELLFNLWKASCPHLYHTKLVTRPQINPDHDDQMDVE